MIQPYVTDVALEYVTLGNDGILRCKVPSYVADFVSAVSWNIDANLGDRETVVGNSKLGNFCGVLTYDTIK